MLCDSGRGRGALEMPPYIEPFLSVGILAAAELNFVRL